MSIIHLVTPDDAYRTSYLAALREYRAEGLEGEYDLGWSRNSDGSFDLIADLWGVAKKHNQTELINSINQKYAVNKTLAAVKQRGLQNANVKLVVQN